MARFSALVGIHRAGTHYLCVSDPAPASHGKTSVVGRLTFNSKNLERIIEGRPEILIHNGKLFAEVLEREKLTHHELNAALRAAGCSCPEEVHYAILENTGQITVQARKRSEPSASTHQSHTSDSPPKPLSNP